MKLSFLMQLILLLLLVLSIYLVFSNSVTGRTKLIVIIFCIVLGLYLYSKLKLFSNYNEFISSPESARQEHIIEGESLKKGDGQFTISVWIYIDDWNYKYGQKKVILTRSLPSNGTSMILPSIELDNYKNDLEIKVNTYDTQGGSSSTSSTDDTQGGSSSTSSSDDTQGGSSSTSSNDLEGLLYTNNIQFGADSNIECVNRTIMLDGVNQNIYCTDVDMQKSGAKIENINMQKWVNIITTVNNRSLDTYINGKLMKTKTFNNVIDTTAFNYGNIVITPNGGFGGYVSKVRYYPRYITPNEAWNIYKDGFGDAFASTLDKYNVSLTFYEDQVEQNKFFLF